MRILNLKVFNNHHLCSPALVSLFLLHGILFGFILCAFFDIGWRRDFTIIFYSLLLFWAVLIIYPRLKYLKVNIIDVLFIAFLIIVISSSISHWWGDTYRLLFYSPFFLILPYVLGRVVKDVDLHLISYLFVNMSLCLVFILPVEYHRMKLPSVDWPTPYIFGQSHGTMLAGQLVANAILVIIVKFLSPGSELIAADKVKSFVPQFKLIFSLAIFIFAIVWLQSRGAIVAVIVVVAMIFYYSKHVSVRRRLILLSIMLLLGFVSTLNPFKNPQSSNYYSAVLTKPELYQLINNSEADSAKVEYMPILGADSCKSVKDSITDRWLHYQTAIAIFFRYPLVGVGSNKYGNFACTKPGSFPHSTILQVLSELGILGIIVYVPMLIFSIFSIYEKYKITKDDSSNAIILWFGSYFVLQLVMSQLYGNYFLSAGLYFAIGIAAQVYGDDCFNKRGDVVCVY